MTSSPKLTDTAVTRTDAYQSARPVLAWVVGAGPYTAAMLAEMRIQGLGVIDDATLEPHRGLTVLTG
ncbi:MAG TPA: hypothetical protein VK735_09510, partial [Pseudonocardia sp.]|uniref:hypothetical protein n=1 Tax=Pseudonocardia sp. TaxID=60912 RepID=UPI002C7741E2